jgi:hypothetical protein
MQRVRNDVSNAKPRCLTLQCAICNAGITNVSRVAGADGSPGWSAGLLAVWCGPWVDQPFLHCEWAVIALAVLVRSCDRYAHVRALLKQVAGDSELQSQKEYSVSEMKAEQWQLVWRFLFSFGVIAGTVAAATLVARWMRLGP